MKSLVACDTALSRLIVALLASAVIILVVFSATAALTSTRTLIWRWSAGPSSGSIAPMALESSWNGIERRV